MQSGAWGHAVRGRCATARGGRRRLCKRHRSMRRLRAWSIAAPHCCNARCPCWVWPVSRRGLHSLHCKPMCRRCHWTAPRQKLPRWLRWRSAAWCLVRRGSALPRPVLHSTKRASGNARVCLARSRRGRLSRAHRAHARPSAVGRALRALRRQRRRARGGMARHPSPATVQCARWCTGCRKTRRGPGSSAMLRRRSSSVRLRERLALDPAALQLRSAEQAARPTRSDWTFTYADPRVDVGKGGEARTRIVVAGDEVVLAGRSVFVPEAWERAQSEREGRRQLAKLVSIVISALAALGALVYAVLAWEQGQERPARFAVRGRRHPVAGSGQRRQQLAGRGDAARLRRAVINQVVVGVLGAFAGGLLGAVLFGLLAGVGAYYARIQVAAPIGGRVPAWLLGVAAALATAGDCRGADRPCRAGDADLAGPESAGPRMAMGGRAERWPGTHPGGRRHAVPAVGGGPCDGRMDAPYPRLRGGAGTAGCRRRRFSRATRCTMRCCKA